MENIDFEESKRSLLGVIENPNNNYNGDLFGKYAAIYLAPTFNVIGAVDLLDTDNINNALVVGTGGAYIHELLLRGVNNIDAFDINVYQYYYYELLKAGIEIFNYDDFIRFFCAEKLGNGQVFSSVFNSYLMEALLPFMEENASDFWNYLMNLTNYDVAGLIESNLFRTSYFLYPEYLREYSSIYDRNKFNKLKDILLNSDYKIDYRIIDIENVPDTFNGNSYDTILFGNIFQYYKGIPRLNTIYRVNNFIQDEISKLLNNRGVCQVCYGFEVASNAVSNQIKREIPNLSFKDKIMLEQNKRITNDERKNGIISSIIRKYGEDYSLDFIDGVETDTSISHKSENVVLSYVKK